MAIPIEHIRALTGNVPLDVFEHIDYAVSDALALFAPISAQCSYAISPEHTHPSFLFVVAFDDYCQVRIKGEIHNSTAGTFSVFSPGVPHQELPSETPARYIAVMIESEYFLAQYRMYSDTPIDTYSGAVYTTSSRLVSALREFMSEHEQKAPGYRYFVDAAGQRISHLFIRKLLGVKQTHEKVDFRMAINAAIEFMHRTINDKLTISEIARNSNLSPSHFAKVFKDETGLTPIEYLLQLRLGKAKRLLQGTSQNMTEIALSCGFNSSSYFSRSFQRQYHVSPSTYRKAIGAQNAS